jgi:hypothetical protein
MQCRYSSSRRLHTVCTLWASEKEKIEPIRHSYRGTRLSLADESFNLDQTFGIVPREMGFKGELHILGYIIILLEDQCLMDFEASIWMFCSDSIGLVKLSYWYRSIVDVGYLAIFRCDQALSKAPQKAMAFCSGIRGCSCFRLRPELSWGRPKLAKLVTACRRA